MRQKAMDGLTIAQHGARTYRLLFVEDDPDDLALVQRELRHIGLSFEGAHVSTPEAFIQSLSGHFDAVVSDFHLGGWTGLDALRELRNRRLDTPFLLVTGTLGEEKA